VPSLRLLWFGLAGAPAAWSLQLLASYPVAANACAGSGSAAMWLLVLISALGIGISLAAVVASLRSLRITDEAAGSGSVVRARIRFMARAGLVTSGTFAVAALLHAGSLLLVGPC
jgi:hypothetical protein